MLIKTITALKEPWLAKRVEEANANSPRNTIRFKAAWPCLKVKCLLKVIPLSACLIKAVQRIKLVKCLRFLVKNIRKSVKNSC